jgi:hypothetical protein
VDVEISGTRTLASKVFIGEGETKAVVVHQGYGPTIAGLVIVSVGLAILRVGVSEAESGDASTGRTLLTVGASVEATGVLMILADLGRSHNRVVIVQ